MPNRVDGVDQVEDLGGGGGGGAVTIANDADVTQGALADAAVITDANGTVSGKLRGLIVLLLSLIAKFPASLGAKLSAASLSVVLSSDHGTIPVTASFTPTFVGTLTDRSVAITTGGTAQTAAALNASRKFFYIQNPTENLNSEPIYVRFGGTAVIGSPSWEIVPGSSEKFYGGGLPLTEAISVISATTGTKIVMAEG